MHVQYKYLVQEILYATCCQGTRQLCNCMASDNCLQVKSQLCTSFWQVCICMCGCVLLHACICVHLCVCVHAYTCTSLRSYILKEETKLIFFILFMSVWYKKEKKKKKKESTNCKINIKKCKCQPQMNEGKKALSYTFFKQLIK